MFPEIIAKLRDSLSMFWQSLDEQERRQLLLAAVYVASVAAGEISARSKKREREQLKREILMELTHA